MAAAQMPFALSVPTQPTLECRWFYEGGIPGPLASAVYRWKFETVPDDRDDVYLVNDAVDVGIKLRGGKYLEVKKRTNTRTSVFAMDRVAGLIETWVKWSFPLAEQGIEVESNGAWITVRKSRKTQKFAATKNGLEPVGLWSRHQAGVNFEVTLLRVDDAAWWTVGFEAFGPQRQLDFLFEQALRCVLTTGGLPDLTPDASMSYPKWLAKLRQG
jgi:hypothetical protein